MPGDQLVATEKLGISGMIATSMLDWEGMLVAILFLGGCNLRCPYCHNADLVHTTSGEEGMAWESVERHLSKKKGWLDGVCITGGEATLNPHLVEITARIKAYGLGVKVDTNGSRPEVVAELIDRKLVDYVAMDVKTSFDKYSLVGGDELLVSKIRESIDLLCEAGKNEIDVEFRTSLVPGIVEFDDVMKIAESLAEKGAKRYSLQKFYPRKVLDPAYLEVTPFPLGEMERLAKECNAFLPTKLK